MPLDRRSFLQLTAAAAIAPHLPSQIQQPSTALRVPRYDQVTLTAGIALTQQQNAQAVLNTFDDDALLKPFRTMGGMDAPGRDLGGWYGYLPDYNWHTGDAGFAPGHAFGQWTSAMARFAAAAGDAATRNRVLRLHHLLAEAITPNFFDLTRFPAYTFDKLNIGLLDAATLLDSPEALAIANKVRQCALPSLPGSAMDRDTMAAWRAGRDPSWHWDESYTLPENLYLLYAAGAGSQYRMVARTYLLETFFTPLAQGQNVLGGLHGYSHVNALSSALQAWLVDGTQIHLDAARNGYRMIAAQTYATGGWAPDETFEKPGSGKLLASLTSTHNTFETPCGTYALLKLARALLGITRDPQFGDDMERILFNSFFAALPLQPDGRTFYYADLNGTARRVYSAHRWPCCAGTYPQVAADFGINTYLLDPEPGTGLWVNLYLPSTLRWQPDNTPATLTQTTAYPLADRIDLHLSIDRPTRFPLHLRLPAWCPNPTLSLNGHPLPLTTTPVAYLAQPSRPLRQSFSAARWATIDRVWHNNDQLTLHLPATYRLEPFPTDGIPQTNLAALCYGPLVLAADRPTPLSSAQLPTLQRIASTQWLLPGPNTLFRPLFAVGDDPYTTYLQLA